MTSWQHLSPRALSDLLKAAASGGQVLALWNCRGAFREPHPRVLAAVASALARVKGPTPPTRLQAATRLLATQGAALDADADFGLQPYQRRIAAHHFVAGMGALGSNNNSEPLDAAVAPMLQWAAAAARADAGLDGPSQRPLSLSLLLGSVARLAEAGALAAPAATAAPLLEAAAAQYDARLVRQARPNDVARLVHAHAALGDAAGAEALLHFSAAAASDDDWAALVTLGAAAAGESAAAAVLGRVAGAVAAGMGEAELGRVCFRVPNAQRGPVFDELVDAVAARVSGDAELVRGMSVQTLRSVAVCLSFAVRRPADEVMDLQLYVPVPSSSSSSEDDEEVEAVQPAETLYLGGDGRVRPVDAGFEDPAMLRGERARDALERLAERLPELDVTEGGDAVHLLSAFARAGVELPEPVVDALLAPEPPRGSAVALGVALSKLRGELPRELARELVRLAQRTQSVSELLAVLTALARVPEDYPVDRLFQHAARLVAAPGRPALAPGEAVALLWAAVHLGATEQKFVSALLHQQTPQARSMPPLSLAMLAWGVAHLPAGGVRRVPAAQLLELELALLHRVDALGPQATATALYACAAGLAAGESSALPARLVERAQRLEPLLTDAEFFNVLYAASALPGAGGGGSDALNEAMHARAATAELNELDVFAMLRFARERAPKAQTLALWERADSTEERMRVLCAVLPDRPPRWLSGPIEQYLESVELAALADRDVQTVAAAAGAVGSHDAMVRIAKEVLRRGPERFSEGTRRWLGLSSSSSSSSSSSEVEGWVGPGGVVLQ